MTDKETTATKRINGVEFRLNFGEYLRKKRIEKNFTQLELAESLGKDKSSGMDKSSICKYEKNKTPFPSEKLIRLAQVLEIDYVELVRAHHIDDRVDRQIMWEYDLATAAPIESRKATVGDWVHTAKDLIDNIEQSFLPLVIDILQAFAKDYDRNMEQYQFRPNVTPEYYDDSNEV